MTEREMSLLHDAELSCIRIDRKTNFLKLSFSLINGTEELQAVCTFDFRNVTTFRIEDFLMQNVIMKVTLSECSELPEGEIMRLVKWIVDNSEGKRLRLIDEVSSIVGSIRDGSRKLFYIDPAWGAEIGVIAQRVEISFKQGNDQFT